MSRIQILPGGRSARFQYGSQAKLTFTIAFPTSQYSGAGTYVLGSQSNLPTTGTLTIAGATVTLVAADILSPVGVAKKIAGATIAGYKTEYYPTISPTTVTLVNDSIGVTARPALALGTATNIFFTDVTFAPGVAISIGAQDDIRLNGAVPMNFTITYTGGTVPDLQFSSGTDAEQATGTLTYGSAVTLATVNGNTQSYTLTAPATYARVTTKASNTTASLYINR